MKIALDAMGGDFGPPNLVAGAVMALHDYKQIKTKEQDAKRESDWSALNKLKL